MPQVHSHKVRLVGVDGQEQSVTFEIETEGVHLLNQKAQVSMQWANLDPVRDTGILNLMSTRSCCLAAPREVSF